jgi:hypothetical protein
LSSSSTPTPEPEPKADALGPNKTLLEQMNSEYGILQDKLDKIGGFRTTIRGWSVTLVIASIIAAGSSKQVSPYFLSLLFVFTYAFYAMERKQNQYGNVFGARILQLEKRMREELRAHVKDSPILGFYPGIAHHLHSSLKRKSSRYIPVWLIDPDHFFYIAQGMAIAVAMAVLVLSGPPPSKSPDVQNIIQTEAAHPEAKAKELGTASRTPESSQIQKREEQKNVKEEGH